MQIINIFKGLFCTFFLLLSNAALADWATIDDISIVKSSGRTFRDQAVYVVQVKVTNNGAETLTGPFRVLIENATLAVIEQDGNTNNNTPYFNMFLQELAPNASMSLTARFTFDRRTRLTFDATFQSNPSDWNMVWNDEFDGNSIDLSKWGYEVNCWGGGNGEQQCYTDRSDNAEVANGVLNIIAKREDFTGPGHVDGSGSATLPYTSARLRTMNKGDWRYGRMEVRAKLPFGQGTWPAIWMLPTDYVYGGWAASGEIDIMEAVNLKVVDENGQAENNIHGTLHYGKVWPENVYSGAAYTLPNNASPADDYHVYAVEWQEDEIRWYVDDVHFATQRSSGWYSQYNDENGELVNGENDAPYNQPFHLLLNLAVGGAWAGNVNNKGVDEAVFPQTLSVDYVRVYECSVSPNTGAGCATTSADAIFVEGVQPPAIADPSDSFGKNVQFDLYTDALAEGLAFNSYNPDGAVVYQEIDVADHGQVIEIIKTGTNGNLYFEYAPHVNLQQWRDYGELVFDVKVASLANDSQLLVKLDSGWPNVSPYTVTLPEIGQWGEVRIPIKDILANANPYAPGSYANILDIANPFVIEPTNTMSLQIDNVRYEYALGDADILTVLGDHLYSPYGVDQYVANGSVDVEIFDNGDTPSKKVTQFSFHTNESVVYFQSAVIEGNSKKLLPFDVSAFSALEFDFKVLEDPRDVRNFMIKMDCGNPCGSGDYEIFAPDIGIWTSYKISLTDLVNNGGSLDLTKVDTPLVIFPAWGNQQGVVMQVANIRLTTAEVDSSGEVDSDNDGINDNVDQCDNTPTNTVVDSVGCEIISDTGGELVINSSFDDGTTPWTGAVAVHTVGDNSFFQADIASAGNAWDVNLAQIITLVPNVTYTFSFKAKASLERTMLAGLGLNYAPWASVTHNVLLTPEWQTFTYTIAPTFGDTNNRVFFDIGAAIGSVFIDDVSVTMTK